MTFPILKYYFNNVDDIFWQPFCVVRHPQGNTIFFDN